MTTNTEEHKTAAAPQEAPQPADEAQLRAALNAVLTASIPPVALGLGLLYILLGTGHLFALQEPLRTPMVAVASVSAVALLALRLALGRYDLPARYGHPLALAIAALVLGNSLLHLQLSSEPRQTTNILLFIVGSGYFFLSRRYFTALVVFTWAAWVAIAAGAAPDAAWLHYGYAMASATLLGSLVHLVRIRTLRRLEGMRLQIERHSQELEKRVEERTVELRHEIDERVQAEARLQDSLGEKEILLKEVHHRVKNNLQVICSLLDLQSQRTEDEAVLEPLATSRGRILTMSLVHEQLYRVDDLGAIPMDEYLERLVGDVFNSYDNWPGHIRIEFQTDAVALNIERAMPCGLIAFELVSNALKHAFPDQRQGTMRVEMRQDNGRVRFAIADDGVGLPPGFDLRQSAVLGLQLVNGLVTQLRGEIEASGEGGARFAIDFPA